MTFTLCQVTCEVCGSDGMPKAGATVSTVLNTGGPWFSVTTDSTGTAVFDLFPSQPGSFYKVKIRTKDATILATMVVPNIATTNLADIAVFEQTWVWRLSPV